MRTPTHGSAFRRAMLTMIAAALAAPALADSPFSTSPSLRASPRYRPSPASRGALARPSTSGPGPYGSAPAGTHSINAERRLDAIRTERDGMARVELRRESRDVERRSALRQLAPGDSRGLERLRVRTRAAEDHDALALRHEVESLDRWLAREDMGPVTRRVFRRYRADLWSARRRERVEAEVRDRELELSGERRRGEAAP